MKAIKYIIAFATSALIAISCIQEEQPSEDKMAATDNLVETSIIVSSENVNLPVWKGDEEISVIGAKTGNKKFVNASNDDKTVFTGLADPSDEILYVVYPYDAAVAIPKENEKGTDEDTELIKVTLPSTQTATANSFDPKTLTAVAKSSDKNFNLKGICRLLKFRLDKPEKVRSVKVTAHNGEGYRMEYIAASAGLKFDDNGNPIHGLSGTLVDGTSSNTIKLIESPLGDQFTKDTDYYISILSSADPIGMTIQIEYDNGEVYSTKSKKYPVFSEGDNDLVADLGIIDNLPVEYLNFSYAGYRHGEVEPSYQGCERYDVSKFKVEGKTDREAFLAALTAAFGTPEDRFDSANDNWWITFPPKDNIEIYFPEGDWVLHDSSDDVEVNQKKYSKSIIIRGNNVVIKGAGRELTRILMNAPMQPRDANDMYSSPDMIQLKHNSGLSARGYGHMVTGNLSPKGSFSVEVESAEGLSEGQWVCLYILNNSSEFVDKEVAPYIAEANWIIRTKGVEVYDYHQIRSINGNIVTFFEPLMHEVDPEVGGKNSDLRWEIRKYSHYQNIGIEDLTFVGMAVEDFEHHKDWNHDGGYKPLSMNRVVDSWIRRVDFVSTSEACSIINSANVSAYDINMRGNRGHAAIRSQASSRVLISDTIDETSNGKGNWHGVGVSKHSMGTVLLRNIWGKESCFESHANQPRATLIDCCKGGWSRGHMGGSAQEAPHHLADLTIWNFTATAGEYGEFLWWDSGVTDWRFLQPSIFGFQPEGVTFPPEQVKIDKLHGTKMWPESLYESQLQDRGITPTWLRYTKQNN